MPKDMPQQSEYAAIAQENVLLQGKVNELERQVAWFQKQVFGSKSERRLVGENPQQMGLDGMVGDAPATMLALR